MDASTHEYRIVRLDEIEEGDKIKMTGRIVAKVDERDNGRIAVQFVGSNGWSVFFPDNRVGIFRKVV